jgi:eukaryotic-like serine/threonine-protein kinase
LPDLVAKSLFSAFLTKHMVSEDSNTKSMLEESFICSMFHTFGDILVTFYFPTLAEKIVEESHKQGIGKDRAASIIIGKSYTEVGQAIARKWHFPEILITNMQAFKPDVSNANLSISDRLQAIITFSNKVGDVLISDISQDEKKNKIDTLSQDFTKAVDNPNWQIQNLISNSFGEMINQADVFNLDLSNSSLMKDNPVLTEKTGDKTDSSKPGIPTELTGVTSVVTSFDSMTETVDENPDAMFSKGIQDISNAMFDKFSLNDIIGIAIETIHRAFYTLGGLNTIFFVKDKDLQLLKYRFGFGKDLTSMRKWFEITLGDQNNIFSAVLSEKKDILINDINSKDIKAKLPSLYGQNIRDDRYVILLPVMPANKPLGLIYIDGESQKRGAMTNNHFNYLRILRDQIILAIRHKI